MIARYIAARCSPRTRLYPRVILMRSLGAGYQWHNAETRLAHPALITSMHAGLERPVAAHLLVAVDQWRSFLRWY